MGRKLSKDHSRDIRDIYYFIDHVKNIEFRISLIKELGYKIGVNIASDKSYEKYVTIGKRNETRVQITPNQKNNPIVKCAIIE